MKRVRSVVFDHILWEVVWELVFGDFKAVWLRLGCCLGSVLLQLASHALMLSASPLVEVGGSKQPQWI